MEPMLLAAPDLAILLAIVLLLFGGSRLAGLGKSTGRALREFKEETRGLRDHPTADPPAVNQPLANPPSSAPPAVWSGPGEGPPPDLTGPRLVAVTIRGRPIRLSLQAATGARSRGWFHEHCSGTSATSVTG